MNCPKCSYELFKSFLFCYECGTKITNENVDDKLKARNANNWSKLKCLECKSVLYNNAKFCQNCGRDTKSSIIIEALSPNYIENKENKLSPQFQEIVDKIKQESKEENKKHAKTVLIGVGLLILAWACKTAGVAIQETGTDTLLAIAFAFAWIVSGVVGIFMTINGIREWWY